MPIVSKPRLKSLIDCETVGYSLALKCVVLTQVNSWLYQLYSLRFTCFIDNNFDIFTYVTELYTSRPGGGTPIWNRRGCSSEIFNLTPKRDP